MLADKLPSHVESEVDDAFSDADSEELSAAFSEADSVEEADDSLLPTNVASTLPFHSELDSDESEDESVSAASDEDVVSEVELDVAAVVSDSLPET